MIADRIADSPLISRTWADFEPRYIALAEQALDQGNLDEWLENWSDLLSEVREQGSRLYVMTSVNTNDGEAKERFTQYLDTTQQQSAAWEQKLKQKLLDSGLEPVGFEIPLRNMRAEAALFREANLPLHAEESKLSMEFDEIMGAQTVKWDGEEKTLTGLKPIYQEADRARREAAWRLASNRQLADREKVNALWKRFLDVRLKMAENADFGRDYRAFRWEEFQRFDYTPDDCFAFHQAIEEVVVPVCTRLYEERRKALGYDSLRPWDLDVDPRGRPPLKPFSSVQDLDERAARVFEKVDPVLGEYYQDMRRLGLLDLDNRKGKAPGGYCETFAKIRTPFIFMNAVGIHDDVLTLLHEGGHAFHVYESRLQRLEHLTNVNTEFAEVASMSMEHLSAPYLSESEGGFYSEADANRAIADHLTRCLTFWPYMAVVDAFQHWVYANPDIAHVGEACDHEWSRLWDRFMPGVDWTGLDDDKANGWHRKLHIHVVPLYYVEYGLAQLGALQVWRNAQKDRASAIAQYRHSLALGGSRPLPELFAAAGARFAFDAGTMKDVVGAMETELARVKQ